MKITFVMANGLGLSGGDRVVSIYAQRLHDRGHEVLVISPPKPKPTLRDQIRSVLKGQGLISTQREPSHFDHLSVPCRLLDRFRPVEASDLPDADVVIATWWETAEWIAKMPASKGAKAYFVQHHEVFDYLPQDRTRATYRLPFHKITIANWLVDIMRTEYGDTDVSLVPNSVDGKQFYASPRGKQAVPTVGMMYGWDWKGGDISIKAFSLASEKIPGLRLMVLSSVPPIPELPLPENSELFVEPPQDTLKDVYASCDAWLFGSRLEGFGLPILEAMACRTPVIGTPAGAAPELLADGAGILVKPEDPEDMARAIVQICQFSEDEWRQMSDLAYNRATTYTWDDATVLFEQALQRAIERQQPKTSNSSSQRSKL